MSDMQRWGTEDAMYAEGTGEARYFGRNESPFVLASDAEAVITAAAADADMLGNGRILTADDPVPAVGSVVLDGNGDAWQRTGSGPWLCPGYLPSSFDRLFISSPVVLIHDAALRGLDRTGNGTDEAGTS